MRYFYNILFYLLLPFILLRLLWKSRKTPAYRQRWSERFGFTKAANLLNPIWVHAVSFGEAKLATTLIEALQKHYPEKKIVVTTMTVTGSEHIRKALGNKVFHSYVPYDYPEAVKRFLTRVKPQTLIILETELWPNILYYCKKANIPIVIANARLANKSAKGYQRISFLIRPIMQKITVLAQTDLDAQRFNQIGVPAKHIHIAGNIKFDVTPPENLIIQGIALRTQLGKDRPIWIAASTHKHEEEIILQAFAQIRQTLTHALLILVPRHPERFDEIANLCEAQQYKITRHSNADTQNTASLLNTDIYLGDTMGELWLFYAAADIAFVGGSLIPQGGHNLLEPAALGIPIITGPHLFNFKQIAEFLQERDALTIVHNEQQLALAVLQLFENKELRTSQGARARQVVIDNQGALEKHLQWIEKLIDNLPNPRI